MNDTDWASLSDEEALCALGEVIDVAFENGNSATTDLAFNVLDELEHRDLSAANRALLHFFRANAWENRQHEAGEKQTWSWTNSAQQNQILELRRAANHTGFCELDAIRQSQIYTNLANNLDAVGRFIEAIEIWDRALAAIPRFAMALGNRGHGLLSYSNALYDPGHAACLMLSAADALSLGCADEAFFESEGHETTKANFAMLAKEVQEQIDMVSVRAILKDPKHDKALKRLPHNERKYKRWALEHRLFLNPLNDLGAYSTATQDIITLPSITIATDAGVSSSLPAIFGIFNQLKQEYVSARFLLYEGVQSTKPHYSDKDVLLTNTLDYPSHGLAVEKVRTAYRLSYSIFDKIAYFLNHYLEIGHPINSVSFRNVWHEKKGKPPKPLIERFKDHPNWPLRGLYWLSKDLFEPEYKETTDPDSRQISELRNHLEHKYLQVHESWAGLSFDEENWAEAIGFHVSRSDFEGKALRLMKLSRAAIIYLSLSVHREEQIRHGGTDDKFVVTLPTDSWEDDWKV